MTFLDDITSKGGIADAIKSYGDATEKNTKDVSDTLGSAEAKKDKALRASDKEESQLDPNALIPPKIDQFVAPQGRSPLEAFGSAAGVLATMGGLLTRKDLVGSLSAATKVLNAYKSQDAAAAQNAYMQWKQNTDNALKLKQFELDSYKEALSKIDTDRAGARADFIATAAAMQNKTAALVAQHGGLDEAVKYVDAMQSHVDRIAENMPAFQQAHQEQQLMAQVVEAQKSKDPQKIADAQQALKDFNSVVAASKGTLNKSQTPAAQAFSKFLQDHADDNNGTGPTAQEMAAFVSSNRAARSPQTMAAQKFIEEHPDATAEDLVKFAADMKLQAAQTVMTGTAEIKADSAALSQLKKTRANVGNFEGTATKESDLVLSLAPKGEAGKSPVINRWVQAGRRGVAGDPDVAAFDAAVTSFKNEYARIMSSPGGTGGVTSDAARLEADALINDTQSPAQINAVIKTMRQGMKNRIDSIDQEIAETQDRIKNGAAGGTGSGANVIKYDAQGNRL